MLVIFGGCGGGKDYDQSFDDLWVVDVENKKWNNPPVVGKKPKGREGHAAGVIKNQMIIYGGKGQKTLHSEMYALNLNNFEWKELDQQGQPPGSRESMSSAVIQDSLYIFGGNISNNPDEDLYTNDLYMISIRSSTAICKKIVPSTGSAPQKRLSHSMSNLNNQYLILYGGESYGKILTDVWAFNITTKIWHEIFPQNHLKGRMTHICYAHHDSFFVFGGMGEDKAALSELAIIKFGKRPNNMNGTSVSKTFNSNHHPIDSNKMNSSTNHKISDYFYCYQCNHDSNSCQFFERFPEIGTPKFNFFAKVQILPYSLDTLSSLFQDPFAALLRIGELLNSSSVFINIIGQVYLRGDVICKFTPPSVSIDLSFLPLQENDEESELRTKMLTEWRSNDAKTIKILEIYSEMHFQPDKNAGICAGSNESGFVSAIFKISDTGLIIVRTEEYYAAFLMKKSETFIPLYVIIYGKSKNIVFPSKEISYANIQNIVAHSHLTNISEIFDRPNGTTIYLYPKEIEHVSNDLFFQGNSFSSLLSKVKDIKYWLCGSHIVFEESNKLNLTENVSYSCNRIDCPYFSVLIYCKKKIIFWDFKKVENNKRAREECFEIKIKDKSLLSKTTGQLDWNIRTMQLYSDIFSCSKKIAMEE